MKTHQGLSLKVVSSTDKETTKQETDMKKQTKKVFKCKMCPSTYYHSASLSKHIVTRHIKVKSN